MSVHDLLGQFEATCLSMDQALWQYRKHGDEAALAEMMRGVSILHAVTDELYDRQYKF